MYKRARGVTKWSHAAMLHASLYSAHLWVHTVNNLLKVRVSYSSVSENGFSLSVSLSGLAQVLC